MTTDFVTLAVSSSVLVLLQLLAALPWLAAVDPRTFFTYLRRPETWLYALLGVLAAGAGLAFFLVNNADPSALAGFGRIYGSVLQAQLTADLFVLVFGVALLLWPKGGAVALSAFRESLRQPMFWLLFFIALFLMWLVPLLPYFTLGEDLKMVKELGYDLIMLFAVVFAVIAAATSISEEIEGRTAVTLMSKPVSRRQFLLGKFLGIFMGALVMAAILGWFMVWMFLFKENLDPPLGGAKDRVADPAWVSRFVADYVPAGEPAGLVRGVGLWFDDSGAALPGLIIVSGQVMVLLAIAVALATRLPMVLNLVLVISVFLVSHLTPTLVGTARRMQELNPGSVVGQMLSFVAQVFDTLLPGLDFFRVDQVLVTDAPPDPGPFAVYVVSVLFYALLYTTIVILFGLVLFEDRDLA